MRKSKKGFTLVELLVVIAIIAIIAAVAVPVTIGQINKSKTKTANSEADAVLRVVEAYLAETADSTSTAEGLKDSLNNDLKKCQYVTGLVVSGHSIAVTYTGATGAKATLTIADAYTTTGIEDTYAAEDGVWSVK